MNCEKYKKSEFCEYNENKIIVVSDKGHPQIKYIIKNIGLYELCVLKVDNGYIQSGKQNKCDFLVINCKSTHSYFVELKGSHLIQAARQITGTIKNFSPEIYNSVINARIVLSKVSVPQYENHPEYLSLKRIIKKYKGTVIQRTRIIEEIMR